MNGYVQSKGIDEIVKKAQEFMEARGIETEVARSYRQQDRKIKSSTGGNSGKKENTMKLYLDDVNFEHY